MLEPERDDGPNPVNIFMIMSVFLVALTSIGFGALIIAGANEILNPPRPADVNPYNLDRRPLPTAQRAADLVVETLGKFKRTQLSGTIREFSATYMLDKERIDIRGFQAPNFSAAQGFVAQVHQQLGIPPGTISRINTEPSYYLSAGTGKTRYIWSHSFWVFDITATSRAVLDEFMKVFKH